MELVPSPLGEEGIDQRRAHSGSQYSLSTAVLSDMESDIFVEASKSRLAETRGSEMEQTDAMAPRARGLRKRPVCALVISSLLSPSTTPFGILFLQPTFGKA